jgi:hypothetical protein
MSTIASTGMQNTGAMPGAERVYRTSKGVRIHGEIPPPPQAPEMPPSGVPRTEADIQKLREYARAKADYVAKYQDEIMARAMEAFARVRSKPPSQPVFQVKQGGQELVAVLSNGAVRITDAGKAAGLDAAFASALKARGPVASRDEEIAWRINFFQEHLGLADGSGGYEVFNALTPVDPAKTGAPNDLRAARNGYLLDLFS